VRFKAPVSKFQQCRCIRSRPITCCSVLSTRCRADTPAPPVGLSALKPPQKAGSLQYMARIRVAPPAHGSAAGGRAPSSRPAPLRSAPGPGPGPGRFLRSAARSMAAPGAPDRFRSTSRLPGPVGPGQHCHVTHASCGARVAPVGPAATQPATWRSPWQPGRRGGNVTCVPRPRRPGWAQRMQGSGGGGRGALPPSSPCSLEGPSCPTQVGIT
jgi:hypothetical protein